jgi:lysophospholipase L1-like esterase
LCLNLGQLLSHSVLDESAWHLFGTRDLLAVSREAALDNTQTSNLIFGHWSSFYANRAGIRNYILNTTDRAYADDLHALARHRPIFPPEEQMIAESRARLREVKLLCQQNGVDFLLLIPPELTNRNNELLAKAAALENVDFDAPVAEGEIGEEFFQGDRFHLNEKGAAIFTDKLARDLRARLENR